ncbi:MAG: LLM class F420-dependent oxidoreductase [Actinomadura sp.]
MTFRLGVNLVAPADRDEWVRKCRRAEALGYDVLLVPDHLEMPAPFPSLVLAAEVTERPRVGTFVLNAAFWNPVLLAREVASTARLTDGRLELGLGAGYVRAEFEEAGLPWESPGARVDHLERTVKELTNRLDTPPPLLIGGAGDRVLRLAAEHAGIVGFTGARTARDGTLSLAYAESVAARVAYVDRHRGGREVEKNILLQTVVATDDRRAAAERLQPYAPDMTPEQLLELPTLLIGTPEEMAEQLRERRELYGFSYITVLEPSLEAFAPVISLLR